MRNLLIAAALATALPALATPTLRGRVVLDTPEVRLSDLWDDAGPRADEIVGTAPAPGATQVVSARQLAHIARLYGVRWQMAHAAERVVLERPGRALPREEIVDPLRAALVGGGDADSLDIEFASWTPPMVPAAAFATVTVERVSHDRATGRFNAVVAVLAEGAAPMRLALAGRAIEMVEVPVAARRLSAGAAITRHDVRMARLPAARAVDAASEAPIGRALDRPLAAGQPFPSGPLGRPQLVRKGERVNVTLASGELIITLAGRALSAGAAGERIEVLNPATRSVIEAEVTGPGRATASHAAPLRGVREARR